QPTTVLCWIRSFKDRPWANRWNNGDVVHLIMCSRRTAVSSKKGDGGEICFKCDPRGTLMEGTMTDYALWADLNSSESEWIRLVPLSPIASIARQNAAAGRSTATSH